jgi:hypothetical protein
VCLTTHPSYNFMRFVEKLKRKLSYFLSLFRC